MLGKNAPQKIIVHHTADARSGPQFEVVEQYHKERWGEKSALGFFTGYHYLIERDGTILHLRKDDEEGMHTIGENRSSLGICLAGNFDYQSPTSLQKLALVKLIDYEVKAWQIPMDEIYPHRKFKYTSCYGVGLADDWARKEYRGFVVANLEHILTILKALVAQLFLYVAKSKA